MATGLSPRREPLRVDPHQAPRTGRKRRLHGYQPRLRRHGGTERPRTKPKRAGDRHCGTSRRGGCYLQEKTLSRPQNRRTSHGQRTGARCVGGRRGRLVHGKQRVDRQDLAPLPVRAMVVRGHAYRVGDSAVDGHAGGLSQRAGRLSRRGPLGARSPPTCSPSPGASPTCSAACATSASAWP